MRLNNLRKYFVREKKEAPLEPLIKRVEHMKDGRYLVTIRDGGQHYVRGESDVNRACDC